MTTNKKGSYLSIYIYISKIINRADISWVLYLKINQKDSLGLRTVDNFGKIFKKSLRCTFDLKLTLIKTKFTLLQSQMKIQTFPDLNFHLPLQISRTLLNSLHVSSKKFSHFLQSFLKPRQYRLGTYVETSNLPSLYHFFHKK